MLLNSTASSHGLVDPKLDDMPGFWELFTGVPHLA
jgi:hypothetical protein